MKNGKDFAARAMTGEKLRLRIGLSQSLAKGTELFLCLMVIEQMETTDHRIDRPGTGCKNVLYSTMSTPREQQTFSIKSQFVTEIIWHIVTLSVLYKQISVSLWHRMVLRNMSQDMQTLGNLASLVCHQKPVL